MYLSMKTDHAKSRDTSPYVSPKELAARWQCSRSTVDRIARREGFMRVCLGTGNNGIVRYVRKEVVAYERKITNKEKGGFIRRFYE